MIPSAAAQHRSKHFDQLLARELAYIERGHELNLLTYEKLERSIRHDCNQTTKVRRKKFSITTIDENSRQQSDTSHSSFISSHNSSFTNQKLPEIIPKYHRPCYKGQRLPPIVKLNRPKRTKNDLHWIASIQSSNIGNEAFRLLTEEIPKETLPKLTPIEKKIRSFMERLPANKGVQKGFDNFGPAALYSVRSPVAMR